MTSSKSEQDQAKNDLMDWIRSKSKEQEEEDGFIFPEPLMREFEKSPKDFTFTRKGLVMVVEWKGNNTMYFPIMEGKKSRDARR